MATSTNYLWTEPNDSDLVKNGASAIRTLGNAIDASVWNVGFGQAGKNKIINGDFGINQRAFTSTTTNGAYTFDRWRAQTEGDGSGTYSTQTFTLGTAPVVRYEGKNFLRILTASQTSSIVRTLISQRIESVRTFAGQTVTFSFWAKAASGTPKLYLEPQQQFGTGGSPSAANTQTGQQVTLSTSWARYSATFNIDSISGKTLGTNNDDYLQIQIWVSAGSDYAVRTNSLGIQNNTFDIWGVQAEAGNFATPFQTATGTIQGETSACQRYYFRFTGPNAYSSYGQGGFGSATTGKISLDYPVTLRTTPISIDFGNLAVQDYAGSGALAVTALTIDQSSLKNASLSFTIASGGVAHQPVRIINNNNTAGYLGLSAEL